MANPNKIHPRMIEELGTTNFIYLLIYLCMHLFYLMSQRVKIASEMGLCVRVCVSLSFC